jgi:hypothetical protein
MRGAAITAVWRLGTFVVGSWWVVAQGWRSLAQSRPRRWVAAGPHVRRWAALGCGRLGLEVEVRGDLPPAGALVVANHTGYIDILTIGSLVPAVFAARHDMRTWPVLGRLAGAGATIFINRQSGRAGVRGVHQVASALGAGATVLGFPVTPETLPVIGWFSGEHFVGHILRLAGHRSIGAEVRFGEPILPPHVDRRVLAASAEARVRALLAAKPGVSL